MKFLKIFFQLIIGILFGKFKYASDTPVMAGLDAVVRFQGKIIAYATGIDWDEDFELQGIRTLGFHGDRDFKSMGYTASFNVGSFVLSGGQIEGALPTPERATILTTKLTEFEVIDLATGKTLYILQGCKCGGKATTLDANALATKATRWRCKNVKPMEVS